MNTHHGHTSSELAALIIYQQRKTEKRKTGQKDIGSLERGLDRQVKEGK